MENIIKMSEDNISFIKKYYQMGKEINEIASSLSIPPLLQETLPFMKINYIVSLNIMELSISLENLQKDNGVWRNNFYIKQACLNIYETFLFYESISCDLNKILDEKDKLIRKQIKLLINNFKEKYSYDEEIRSIRNHAAAHFDCNILDFLEELEKLDKNKCINMISEFILILFTLLLFVLEIYEKKTDVMSIDISETQAKLKEQIQHYKEKNDI
jgi:hypothetical protein